MELERFFHRRTWRTVLRVLVRHAFGRRGERKVQGLRLYYRARLEAVRRLRGKIGRIIRRSEAKVWVDGSEAFARIEELIRRAQHTVVIQMFIWKDDVIGRRIAEVLLEAADRGVRVDVTKEAMGDVFELSRDFLSTSRSDDAPWRDFWSHPNIHIVHTRADDHAKVYVIDDHILLLGGMNIADEYHGSWHDYMVELRGSRFVRQYFMEGAIEHPRHADVRLFVNTRTQRQIRPCVRELLVSARRSIVVEQCYLSDPEVVSLLARRSREGVRVTVIIPEHPDIHYHANMQALERLLREGSLERMQVFLYPEIVHGKLVLVDRSRLFIGSANLIASSLDAMGEANVLIEGRHRRAVLRIREVLRKDILRSKPLITPPRLRWVGRWLAALGL